MLPDMNFNTGPGSPSGAMHNPNSSSNPAKSTQSRPAPVKDQLVSLAASDDEPFLEEEKDPVDYFGPIKGAITAYVPHSVPRPVRIMGHVFLEALPALLIISTILTALFALGWVLFLFYITYL